jgi:hypothetical protein
MTRKQPMTLQLQQHWRTDGAPEPAEKKPAAEPEHKPNH